MLVPVIGMVQMFGVKLTYIPLLQMCNLQVIPLLCVDSFTRHTMYSIQIKLLFIKYNQLHISANRKLKPPKQAQKFVFYFYFRDQPDYGHIIAETCSWLRAGIA